MVARLLNLAVAFSIFATMSSAQQLLSDQPDQFEDIYVGSKYRETCSETPFCDRFNKYKESTESFNKPKHQYALEKESVVIDDESATLRGTLSSWSSDLHPTNDDIAV